MKLIEPVDGEIILTKEETIILDKARTILKEIRKNLERIQHIKAHYGEDVAVEESLSVARGSTVFIDEIFNGWHYCKIEKESEE